MEQTLVISKILGQLIIVVPLWLTFRNTFPVKSGMLLLLQFRFHDTALLFRIAIVNLDATALVTFRVIVL